MSNFIEVAQVDEISEGVMKSFSVEGKHILIIKYDGNYYAMGGKCPYMSGDLSKGTIEGKIVTCPKHGSKFDVTTGECIAGPKIAFIRLKSRNGITYATKIEGKSIKVSVLD